MRLRQQILSVVFIFILSAKCFAQDSKQEVLEVVNKFFHTMENKDDVAFNNLFLENAYAYSVRKQGDSTLVRNSILKASTSKNVLKERLREEEITIHINNQVAAVIAPYDFWINGEHSHFGYEVFTLIKKKSVWKIASLTYSVTQDACEE
jgi:predicted RNA binding protein with dsRBD fold (UPF0201 family)